MLIGSKRASNAARRGTYRSVHSTTQACTYARTVTRTTEKREGDITKDYQPKKNGYYLPDDVYRRALAHIRAYPAMCRRRDEIIRESPSGDAPGRSGVGRPTESKAIRLSALYDDVAAVEKALDKIPREYRQGIMDNLIARVPMCRIDGASEATWKRWRARLLWQLARNMRWI